MDSIFAVPPAADIRRWRRGIGSDTRNVHQPLRPRIARIFRDPLRSFDVHGMECLVVPLHVQAYGIYDSVGVSDCGIDGGILANVRPHRFQRRSRVGKDVLAALWMPRSDPHSELVIEKVL